MEDKIYNLIGYHLEFVKLIRPPYGSEFEKINISIDSIKYSSDRLVQFVVIFCLTSRSENKEALESEIRFRVAFEVSTYLFNVLSGKSNAPTEITLNDDINEDSILASLVAYVFPFLRQQLYAMTNDYANKIDLPLLDARDIVHGIQLSSIPDSDS